MRRVIKTIFSASPPIIARLPVLMLGLVSLTGCSQGTELLDTLSRERVAESADAFAEAQSGLLGFTEEIAPEADLSAEISSARNTLKTMKSHLSRIEKETKTLAGDAKTLAADLSDYGRALLGADEALLDVLSANKLDSMATRSADVSDALKRYNTAVKAWNSQ